MHCCGDGAALEKDAHTDMGPQNSEDQSSPHPCLTPKGQLDNTAAGIRVFMPGTKMLEKK